MATRHTVEEMLVETLKTKGYHALYNLEDDCYCDFPDIGCDGVSLKCVGAYFVNDYDRCPPGFCCTCKYMILINDIWNCRTFAKPIDFVLKNDKNCDKWEKRKS